MEARPLPSHPDLEQYKKQAKELLKARVSTDPSATRLWVEEWVRSYASEEAEVQARLRGVLLTQKLRELARREETARVETRIRESRLVNSDARLVDAQYFLARMHGFESWPKFATQIRALQSANSPDAKFEAAADAIVSGHIAALRKLVDENPRLITARSQRSHHGTLLHYVAANGIEGFRQKTPKNIVEIAKLLLDAGADVNAECEAYGGGSVVLLLAATSVHPYRAGVQEELLQVLLDRGARMDGPDGKPYALALPSQ